MSFKQKIMKFRLKYLPGRIKPEEYNNYLRSYGISVGKGTIFYAPNTIFIDTQRTFMLKIGDYCKITKGTSIFCHDYSRSVLRRAYGEIVAEAAMTVIGNNVFIGANSIILMGATIGNNVIVGAGSVVAGRIPDNVVVAGNPAKIVRTLDEHYKKRKKEYVAEAKEFARAFYLAEHRKPTIHDMGAFFPLYLKRNEQAIVENGLNINLNGDESSEILRDFIKSEPYYPSFEAFLQEVEFDD